MSAIDDLATLIESVRSRSDEMKDFKAVLSEISVALGELIGTLEHTPEPVINIQAAAAPQVEVNVAAPAIPPAPEVNVTVQPAQVVIMPATESAAPKGWKLRITARDGNGAIQSISLIPEI